MRLGKIPDQVLRLIILFAFLLTGLLLLRSRFVPETFGVDGHFRSAAVDQVLEQEIRFAGSQACLDCHDDVGELKESSFHRGVACETCHGAGALHIEEGGEIHRPQGRTLCLSCHQYLLSRPTGFPQVQAESHNPTKACMDCHDPHEPTPPEVPSSCGACHASVARTKSVSHHASLDCTTCHEAPPEHRENPRAHLVKKPASRAFCGQCHATTADSPRHIPRIELDSHGTPYVCWQCHYPHYPEAR